MGALSLALLPFLLMLPWRRIAGEKPVRGKTDLRRSPPAPRS
jgi:hypothetical protein